MNNTSLIVEITKYSPMTMNIIHTKMQISNLKYLY